ncbi:MAG: NAD(P)H-binding protein [Anaerolineales bacterium]|jgi:putative NADH-flavin reductase
MKIAILGSTGFVGKILLEKALEKGYQVKTLVRDPKKLGNYMDRVEFVSGDASQTDRLEKTIVGTEAVLSTLPPVGNNKVTEKSAKAMEDLVAILERNAVKRFIHIGGAVHGGGTNENWTLSRRLLKLYLNIVCKPVLIAKQLEWELLRKSKLNWTLVRPPRIIKGKPEGHLAADEKNLASVQVNVEDLVEFMLEQITSERWIAKAPLVATYPN